MNPARNKRWLVIGLGRSGFAAAKFLAGRGIPVTVSDKRPESDLAERIANLKEMGADVECGGHNPETFRNADILVVSPGVPLEIEPIKEARERGAEIIGEVELAYRHLNGKVVAITGSNGKSTTTTLLGQMLQDSGVPACVGGNLGTPLSELIPPDGSAGLYVLELSSFQLDTIQSFRPDVAVLLNITPDHMDRYHSFEAYANSKWRIFENQSGEDHALINEDDEGVRNTRQEIGSRAVPLSLEHKATGGVYLRRSWVVSEAGKKRAKLFPHKDLKLPGRHNLSNAAAAAGAAAILGATREGIAKTLSEFRGLDHRLSLVFEGHGLRFYNDSKATNVDASLRALESFPGNVILIMGGQDKGLDFSPLREPILYRVKLLLLIGEATDTLREQLGGTTRLMTCGNMERAVKTAYEFAREGDVILLAPGCASFDQYRNFEERGDHFAALAREFARKKFGTQIASGEGNA